MKIWNDKLKNKIEMLFVLFLLCTLLAGCGKDKAESYTQLGMSAVQNLEYEEALNQFSIALENGEDKRLIYRGMGLAYMGMTKYEEAVDCLENALKESNGYVRDIDFDLNYYLATAYFKNGQAQEAIGAYDAILALRPKEKDAFYLRGCVKLAQGDCGAAEEDFEQAVSLDPRDYDQLIRIYTVMQEYGYGEEGVRYLNGVVAENGKDISDYDMGRICYYLGDYEKARDYLTNLKTDTDYGAALYLGRTYEALGDYNYAASIYSRYVESDQTKAELYNQLGMCRLQMGEYEAALTAFQAAMNIEDNGMMQTLKFNEIVTYEYMRDFKTAATLMSSYLKSYPDDEVAKREYEFLQTR